MSFSDVFSAVMKVRRVLILISVIGGAGYKYGPVVFHKVEGDEKPKETVAAVKPRIEGEIVTNSAGLKLRAHDLGTLSLTNHFERCVPLGKGKECLLTPVMLDKETVQLTVAVETKTPSGKMHDLSITQVTAASGKSLDLAVGDYSFSLTPNVVLQ